MHYKYEHSSVYHALYELSDLPSEEGRRRSRQAPLEFLRHGLEGAWAREFARHLATR